MFANKFNIFAAKNDLDKQENGSQGSDDVNYKTEEDGTKPMV